MSLFLIFYCFIAFMIFCLGSTVLFSELKQNPLVEQELDVVETLAILFLACIIWPIWLVMGFFALIFR